VNETAIGILQAKAVLAAIGIGVFLLARLGIYVYVHIKQRRSEKILEALMSRDETDANRSSLGSLVYRAWKALSGLCQNRHQ